MQKFENIGDWVQKKYGGQVKAAKAMGTTQGVISSWINGQSIPSPEKQELMRGKGEYDGPMPEKKGKGPAGLYVTREEYGALDARLKAAEKSLEETRAALVGATGAIRMLALKAGSPEIEALLK